MYKKIQVKGLLYLLVFVLLTLFLYLPLTDTQIFSATFGNVIFGSPSVSSDIDQLNDLGQENDSKYAEFLDQAVPIFTSIEKGVVQKNTTTAEKSPGIIIDSAAVASEIVEVAINRAAVDPEIIREDDILRIDVTESDYYLAYIEEVTGDTDQISLWGRIKGSHYGVFAMSDIEGQTMAVLRVPELGLVYTLIYDSALETHYLFEIALDDLDWIESSPPQVCDDEIRSGQSSGEVPSEDDYADATDSGVVITTSNPNEPALIDMMVLYTPLAMNWAGGFAGILNQINIAMNLAQEALTNSETGVTLRLVLTAEVDYISSGNDRLDLRRLSFDDGTWEDPDTEIEYDLSPFLDEIHAWRDNYGADLVALFDHVDYGGIAWVPGSFPRPDLGFSISRVQQVHTGYTHIHEIGHNMGAAHHKLQNHQPGPNSDLNSYSAGWRFEAGDPLRLYNTLMSYSSGHRFTELEDPFRGIPSIEIGYFSNPEVNYLGVPTGCPVDGDNARTLKETKHYVAGYREKQIFSGPQLISPQDGSGFISSDVKLIWSTESSISGYHLQVSTCSSFAGSHLIIDDDSIIDNNYIFGLSSDGTTYYWRVKANHAAGGGEWWSDWSSPAFNFTDAFPLENLQIGDRVADPSWSWRFKYGSNYGEQGPWEGRDYSANVTWIVVAKEHYGEGTGVTLISERLLGFLPFDDSYDRGHWLGSNHWGESGTTTAERGLRTWLNSTGPSYGEGFYQAFSGSFKHYIKMIELPNREFPDGSAYTTTDKVFIASATELGDVEHTLSDPIGSVFPFFAGVGDEGRIALLCGLESGYWTRTPQNTGYTDLRGVTEWGNIYGLQAYHTFHLGARPVVNLVNAVPVAPDPFIEDQYLIYDEMGHCVVLPPDQPFGETRIDVGVNHIFITGNASCNRGYSLQYRFDWGDGTITDWADEEVTLAEYSWNDPGTYLVRAQARCTGDPADPVISDWSDSLTVVVVDHQPGTLGALEIGDRVVDNSWQWEHRLGIDYSDLDWQGNPIESGETKPVNWIVVAKDHYGPNSGVTLLAEELIGKFRFDNSTDRGSDFGSNHWGNSGTTDADKGLRPWLNSTGIHAGQGFYEAFSSDFKNLVRSTNLPNRTWEEGSIYFTSDNVFIPSISELGEIHYDSVGGSSISTYHIGSAFPYFDRGPREGNFPNTELVEERIKAELGGDLEDYWTRSPIKSHPSRFRTYGTGTPWANNYLVAVRPIVNLDGGAAVSDSPNSYGVYELIDTQPDEMPGWHNISQADAQVLTYDGGVLAASVDGYGIGLFVNNDWINLTSVTAMAMVTDGSTLFASVEDNGIWAYDGEWNQLTPVTAELLAVDNGMIAASFAGFGIWLYDGIDWINLTPASARALAFDSGMLAASVYGLGTWLNTGGEWQQLTVETAQHLALSGNDLVAFFDGYGLWRYDGEWNNLTPAAVQALALDNGILAVSVHGLGTWLNDSATWQQLDGSAAQHLGMDRGSLAASFEGAGVWLYE